MSVKLTVSIGLLVLLLSASDAFGFSSGGRSRRESVSSGAQGGGGGGQANVPEPSTLYAVGSALALLGGAGWYIRRRK